MIYDKEKRKIIEFNHDSSILNEYHSTLARVAKVQFPFVSDRDIDGAINYSINKRYKEEPCRVDNNYSNKSVNMNLKEVTDYIMDKEPIITNWGVMWKRKGTVPNPLAKMVKMFMDLRGIHKKEMFKYPKGSENFVLNNMLQLLDKVDVNAILIK